MKCSDECFLGFDTSCYTTSVAVVSKGRVLLDNRMMLPVPKGDRGMRQSEAVFHHVKNMKQLFLSRFEKGYHIKAVGYSGKPCPKDDSYMPVFCVGESFAVACAAALDVDTYAFTHQHGHIYSAFLDNALSDGTYCMFHVSGGTLDVLRVRIQSGIVTEIAPIGGSLDITCGQLIDRVGVAAGLSFPAGKEMEALYKENGASLAVHVKGLQTNLSGAEIQALRMLRDGQDIAYVCSGVIDCVAKTLAELVENTVQLTDLRKFVFTGGVICNNIIRTVLEKVCMDNGCGCIMAQKAYANDNACGLALAAEILYNKGEKR